MTKTQTHSQIHVEARSTRQILVVDDEPDIAKTLQTVLRGFLQNVEVLTAASGDEALKRLATGRFDLIVSDYRMPRMDGIEFLARAKALQPDAVRVLLTAYPDARLAQRATEASGVAMFMTKPVYRPEFVPAIRALLQR